MGPLYVCAVVVQVICLSLHRNLCYLSRVYPLLPCLGTPKPFAFALPRPASVQTGWLTENPAPDELLTHALYLPKHPLSAATKCGVLQESEMSSSFQNLKCAFPSMCPVRASIGSLHHFQSSSLILLLYFYLSYPCTYPPKTPFHPTSQGSCCHTLFPCLALPASSALRGAPGSALRLLPLPPVPRSPPLWCLRAR